MVRTPLLSRLNARRDLRHRQRLGHPGRRPADARVLRLAPAGAALPDRRRGARSPASSRSCASAGRRATMPLSPLDPMFALLWAIGAACAIGAALQAKFHRLAALIMVGGVGLVTCLTFAWFSAPDLALTQIAVEVVTLVLILLGLRWLPRRLEIDDARRTSLRARARRARDLAVAAAAGIGAAALAFAVLTRPSTSELARLLPAERLRAGRRPQRRERHAGGLPRLRHARRDHGRLHRRHHRVCAAAPLPAGAREHRGHRSARSARKRNSRRSMPCTSRCPRARCARPPSSCGSCCRWRASSRRTSCCAATMRPAAASSAAS